MEKILITGASSGIGKELARNLAVRSRKMYLLARSEFTEKRTGRKKFFTRMYMHKI